MPDDGEDGTTDRDGGFLLAALAGNASVAFGEEGVSPAPTAASPRTRARQGLP
jgi:hypothetical protein